jgi:hypothetical protein
MTAEGKIFSVAVSQAAKTKDEPNFVYKDMDNQPTDRPVILCSTSGSKQSLNKNLLDDSDSEFLPVHRDPTAVIDYEDNKEKFKADKVERC